MAKEIKKAEKKETQAEIEARLSGEIEARIRAQIAEEARIEAESVEVKEAEEAEAKRYELVTRKKYIVKHYIDTTKDFAGIQPMIVLRDGKEYFDLNCVKYDQYRGVCGEEVELTHRQVGMLKSATRPKSSKIKDNLGNEKAVVKRIRNYTLESVD